MDSLELLPLPAALVSDEGLIVRANRPWRSALGDAAALADIVKTRDGGPLALSDQRPTDDCLVKQRDESWRWASLDSSRRLVDDGGTSRRLVWVIDVHERHEREADLQRRVTMQADMLDASVDCIKIIDPNGLLLHMNRAGCEALGVAPQGVAGTEWLALLPAEVRERGAVALKHAVEGRVARFPGCSQIEGAEPQYWDNVLTPLGDAHGVPAMVLCVSRNTTAQRVVEDRLNLAIRATNEVIRDWDVPAARITWNDAFERCYGYPPERHVCGVEWWLSRVHEDDRARVGSFFQDLLAGRRDDYALEYRFANAQGHHVEVRDRGCLSRGPAGDVVRVVGSLADQTERKAVERSFEAVNKSLSEQITERTGELNRLWNLSPDLFVVLDRRGNIRRANPAAHRIFGYSPLEALGHHISEFILPADVARLHKAFSLVDVQVNPVVELRHRHRDGTCRWVSWAGVVSGAEIYAAGRDVTAEHEARALLKQTEDELRQAQKMESLGQLTGGIAHDFNNLLASIGGALEIMRRRSKTGQDLTPYIDIGEGSVRRAAALTQRLLAFSRRQALDPRPTDINLLVQGMVDLIGRTVGPAVRVAVRLAPSPWATLVDGPQMENALLNLCINARDAMPDGGQLTVVTANQFLGEAEAAARELPMGEYVRLDVIDTGTGMSPSVVQRVFEPFFTTKPLGRGTGLGLSMVYGFVRQSGGTVAIDSEVGRGTQMTLLLPRHAGEALAVEASAPHESAVGSGETILVIEDDEPIRRLLTEFLSGSGYRVLSAQDGPEGLKILKARGDVDLVVTDVGLPGGMNGRQVADAGRELQPKLKVLFITGYAEAAAAGVALAEDGMQVLTKPFEFAALMKKVRETLDGDVRQRASPLPSCEPDRGA
ncbi:MAG: PAS domain S-box protein [Proteobacteria bacterium]|nr:PAS domain S-box protein [Pseudomonadota bacterium]